jgi:branched-chain amino acid transport system substrate-binding protein
MPRFGGRRRLPLSSDFHMRLVQARDHAPARALRKPVLPWEIHCKSAAVRPENEGGYSMVPQSIAAGLRRFAVSGAGGVAIAALMAMTAASPAHAADPIKIGFSIPLTGAVAAGGKQVLLALEIWRDDVNAKGGLLGRQVVLDYYDDQSNPANVPGIYTKLIEIDKVDLTVGPYATNMVVPSIPVLMQHNMASVGILAVGANREFHDPKYFAMISSGPDPRLAFSEGFFAVAMAQNPKPQTVAITGADADFARISTDGARVNAEKAGLKIVYDKSYPPNTTDFAPIIHAVQATNPDIVYNASYPPDTVGMIRAANEIGLKTKMFGGNMIGLVTTVFKMQLGPGINGLISTADVFVPSPKFDFPGSAELMKTYQAKATAEGADPLGYNYAPFGYAAAQALAEAVAATKSLDQDKIADWLHHNTLHTVVGEFTYGPDGEWTKPRVIVSQFQHVSGNGAEQFKDMTRQVILWPPEYKSGEMIYPYNDAKN